MFHPHRIKKFRSNVAFQWNTIPVAAFHVDSNKSGYKYNNNICVRLLKNIYIVLPGHIKCVPVVSTKHF